MSLPWDGKITPPWREADLAEAREVLGRLADGLQERDIVPGRNPDGVNDDPEKAMLVLDEWRQRAETAEAALWECVKVTGADVSAGPPRPGTGDWPQLPELAVREVTELRAELEEAGELNDLLRTEMEAILQARSLEP